MPDEIIVPDEYSRMHVENLNALYRVACAEADKALREHGRWAPNHTLVAMALRATLQAYDQRLERDNDGLFIATGQAVMKRWCEEIAAGKEPWKP